MSQMRNGNADLADFALCQFVVRVVARLRRQVESDEPRLPLAPGLPR